jgi:hypothetical protein
MCITRKLSQEQYTEKEGLNCPVCGASEPEESHSPDFVGPNLLYHGCYCSTCKSSWQDVYKLIGYDNVWEGETQAEKKLKKLLVDK